MKKEEAVARIREHMIFHKNKEPRAIYITEALEMAIEALEQARPKGKWIEVEDAYGTSWFRCDKCGDFEYVNSDYCPLCGADMKENEKDGKL